MKSLNVGLSDYNKIARGQWLNDVAVEFGLM